MRSGDYAVDKDHDVQRIAGTLNGLAITFTGRVYPESGLKLCHSASDDEFVAALKEATVCGCPITVAMAHATWASITGTPSDPMFDMLAVPVAHA